MRQGLCLSTTLLRIDIPMLQVLPTGEKSLSSLKQLAEVWGDACCFEYERFKIRVAQHVSLIVFNMVRVRDGA